MSVLAPALAIGCAGEPPPDLNTSRGDEGRVVLGSTSLAHRNFDARESHNARLGVNGARMRSQLTDRFAADDIAATFDATTGVTRTLKSRTGFLTEARTDSPEAIALDFVRSNRQTLGLNDADLAGMVVTDKVYSRVSGTTHIYFGQRHLGLPVYNAQLQFNIHHDGRIVSINNSFVPDIAGAAKSASPALGAVEAVASAAANLSLELTEMPEALSAPLARPTRRTLIEAPQLSKAVVDSQLAWLPVNAEKVALTWRFQLETIDGNHLFDYMIDAEDAGVWIRLDWTNAESYRAYPQPVESANHASPPAPADGRVVITDPADPTASPLGWRNNGTSTFTIHRGNNVHAYDDRDANNAPPSTQPTCSASLDCDFPLDLAGQPSTYISAALSNLFYWNNLVHDIQYQYGFDEEAGNFQVSNFDNGGAGGDGVNAEAQDGARTNNAFFTTPPDGTPGRMEMFEWTTASPRRDGDLDNGIITHEYGHGISNRQVGGPSNVNCLGNIQQGGEGWSDWFALWYTTEEGDAGTDPRGIGTYALAQPTSGAGIRTQRYSTDPAINNHTYQSIRGKAVPHGVGEVWAQALWEVHWALVDRYGFDPDRDDALGDAGNQRAMLYVNEGLKNTACSPTFVDARDGIIAAATTLHGGEDVCLLWETFAAFGLGTDALSGGPNSLNATNGFAIPAECECSPAAEANAGPDQQICAGDSVQIGTPERADTSYSWSPGGETTAQITVSPTETTVYTVTATTSCGSTSDSVVVRVDSGAGAFSDDFETGAGDWTATGLWHLADNSNCAAPGFASPTHAFYYGRDATCTYETGASNTGDLTSAPIAGITADSVLSFGYHRQVERFNGSFDRTQVDIVRSNGTATTVFNLDSRTASQAAWVSSGNISLSAFTGDTIRVRFRFNTGDGASNGFVGWFIDDVTVTTGSVCLAP